MTRHPRFFVVLAAALLATHAVATTAAWGNEAVPETGETPGDPHDILLLFIVIVWLLIAAVVVLGLAILAVVLAIVLLFVLLMAATFLLAFGIVFVALLVLAAVAVCAVLVALGFGATLAVVAAAVLLPCVWIVGISVAFGFLCHSVRSAFRAAFIQVGALAGIACGIGLLWGSNRLVQLGLTLTWVVLFGGTAGLAGGVAVALLFNWAWSRALDWVSKRWGRKRTEV